MTNGQPIISIRGLTKTYHAGEVDVHALRGVDLDVQAGEFVSIVGPSGSGKSTLFNIVGGLTPPTSGSIQIAGRDLLVMTDAERTELRKTTVGFVFQKYNLLPTLTARDNIAIARDIAHKNGPLDPQFVEMSQAARHRKPSGSQASRAFRRRAAARGHRPRHRESTGHPAGR